METLIKYLATLIDKFKDLVFTLAWQMAKKDIDDAKRALGAKQNEDRMERANSRDLAKIKTDREIKSQQTELQAGLAK